MEFSSPLSIGFNFCNGRILMFVAKNSCNRRLRSLLPEVFIGNGFCGGEFRVGNDGRQITTVTYVSSYNRC
jgi:hypothetical protein